jgi:hypothetical protein
VKAFRSWLKTDFCKSAFNAKIGKQIAAKIVEKNIDFQTFTVLKI